MKWCVPVVSASEGGQYMASIAGGVQQKKNLRGEGKVSKVGGGRRWSTSGGCTSQVCRRAKAVMRSKALSSEAAACAYLTISKDSK